MTGAASREECYTKHVMLKHLDDRDAIEEFWTSIHNQFLAKVEPVRSGLQDALVENHVLTETDNESLGGSHLPTRKDRARQLFSRLYSIPDDVFHDKVLPVLCHKYHYIIPEDLWEKDFTETMMAERLQQRAREKEEKNKTVDEGASCHRNEGVCLRCLIQKRRRIRPTTLADFLFRQKSLPLEKYQDISSRFRAPDWWTIFSSFKSLPSKDSTRHITELTSLLDNYSVPVPSDLHIQMRKGFPCRCGLHSVTKGLSQNRHRKLRRVVPRKVMTHGHDDVSSVTTYPRSVPDSSHSGNNSLASNSAVTSNQPDGQSDWLETRASPGTGQLDLVSEQSEDTTPVGPAGDQLATQQSLQKMTPKKNIQLPPIFSIAESTNFRRQNLLIWFENLLPDLPKRYASTPNLSKLQSCPVDQTGKINTWPRVRKNFPELDCEDFSHDRGLQDTSGSDEIQESALLKELEDKMGKTVDEKIEDWENVSNESKCSSVTLVTMNTTTIKSGAVLSMPADKSRSDGTSERNVGNADSSDAFPKENQEKRIASEKQMIVPPKTSIKGIPERFSNTESLQSAAEYSPQKGSVAALRAQFERPHRPKQGEVSRRMAQLQSPVASYNVAGAYLQHDTDQQGQTPQKSISAMPRETMAGDRGDRYGGKQTYSGVVAGHSSATVPASEDSSMAESEEVGMQQEEMEVTSEEQLTGHSQTSVTGVTECFGNTQPLSAAAVDRREKGNVTALRDRFECPPSSEKHRANQGKVPRRKVQFQSPSASEMSPLTYQQCSWQRERSNGDTNPQARKTPQMTKFVSNMQLADDRESKNDNAHDNTTSDFPGNKTESSFIKGVPELSAAIPLIIRGNSSMNDGRSSEACRKSDSNCYVWDAVANAKKNRDLSDIYQYASTEVTDLLLKQLFEGAVITPVTAKEEITQQLHICADLMSVFGKIRQKRQDAGLIPESQEEDDDQTPPRTTTTPLNDSTTVAGGGINPDLPTLLSTPPDLPPDPPADSVVISEVSSLLPETELLCGEMLVLTRVYTLIMWYVYVHSEPTTDTSRTKALTMMREVTRLCDRNREQAWQLLARVDELRVQLPAEDRGVRDNRVGETVALVKMFLDIA